MADEKTEMWQMALPWLKLHLAEGLGPLRIAKLVEHFGSAPSALNASQPELTALLNASLARNIANIDYNRKVQLQIEKTCHWLHASEHHFILCPDFGEYPALLRELPDFPPVLFLSGNLSLLATPQIAIVGSRRPTLQGKKLAEKMAAELARKGLTITSGLAMGIDASAHHGAMTATQSSIAVIGTGIDRVYPAENRLLAGNMAEEGLVISEFPLGTAPMAGNFPKRNRIISGLSLGVLVVEATERSGSLITARLALEQGREVFAMPGAVNNLQAQGCHRLIRDGAVLVVEAGQIIAELAIRLRCFAKQEECSSSVHALPEAGSLTKKESGPSRVDESVSCPVQKTILQAIGSETWHLDELILNLDIPQESISYALTLLEVAGLITLTSRGYRKS